MGLATVGVSSSLHGCELRRAKDAPREMCFGEAGGLTRIQAGVVPRPADRHGPGGFPRWWCSRFQVRSRLFE